MKKLALLVSSVIALFSPITTFANSHPFPSPSPITIKLTAPANIGFKTIGDFITNALTLSFALAILIVLVMLIWGAFEWITSGGDKEAVGKARGRIVNALIGLAVLAVAFALARVAGQFVGLDFSNIIIPTPQP